MPPRPGSRPGPNYGRELPYPRPPGLCDLLPGEPAGGSGGLRPGHNPVPRILLAVWAALAAVSIAIPGAFRRTIWGMGPVLVLGVSFRAGRACCLRRLASAARGGSGLPGRQLPRPPVGQAATQGQRQPQLPVGHSGTRSRSARARTAGLRVPETRSTRATLPKTLRLVTPWAAAAATRSRRRRRTRRPTGPDSRARRRGCRRTLMTSSQPAASTSAARSGWRAGDESAIADCRYLGRGTLVSRPVPLGDKRLPRMQPGRCLGRRLPPAGVYP